MRRDHIRCPLKSLDDTHCQVQLTVNIIILPHFQLAFLTPCPHLNFMASTQISDGAWLPGEIWRYGRGNEGLHGFPMDLLEHEQDLWTLRDQFTLAAGVKLFEIWKRNSTKN